MPGARKQNGRLKIYSRLRQQALDTLIAHRAQHKTNTHSSLFDKWSPFSDAIQFKLSSNRFICSSLLFLSFFHFLCTTLQLKLIRFEWILWWRFKWQNWHRSTCAEIDSMLVYTTIRIMVKWKKSENCATKLGKRTFLLLLVIRLSTFSWVCSLSLYLSLCLRCSVWERGSETQSDSEGEKEIDARVICS